MRAEYWPVPAELAVIQTVCTQLKVDVKVKNKLQPVALFFQSLLHCVIAFPKRCPQIPHPCSLMTDHVISGSSIPPIYRLQREGLSSPSDVSLEAWKVMWPARRDQRWGIFRPRFTKTFTPCRRDQFNRGTGCNCSLLLLPANNSGRRGVVLRGGEMHRS